MSESEMGAIEMVINVQRLNPDAVIPAYAHDGDAGFDLVAVQDVIVAPGETVKVPTGLAFAIPDGYEMQIRPRSGITSRTKLRVQLGTIDASYRGEVSVIVDNVGLPDYAVRHSVEDGWLAYPETQPTIQCLDGTEIEQKFGWYVPVNTYIIRKGDRIAQGVIAPVIRATLTPIDALDATERGSDGFGSSGI